MNKVSWLILLIVGMPGLVMCNDANAQWHHDAEFMQYYWFEKGIEHGNPIFTNRIRVNAPEAGLGPYHERVETRGNGMVQILTEVDLTQINKAELYAELWGGHPGTARKRVSINGRSIYPIYDVAHDHHCTYTYPRIPLKITDLVNGYNAIQFACDQGTAFWGHFLIDNVALVLYPPHDAINNESLQSFEATVDVQQKPNQSFQLNLNIDEKFKEQISHVVYQGFYQGYDENGDGLFTDWHGFTKNREPVAWIGKSDQHPYAVDWDTSFIPEQDNIAFRAEVYFKDSSLIYRTEPVGPYSINHEHYIVKLYQVEQLPKPFWSRDNQLVAGVIHIDEKIEQIKAAQLHVVIWDGGSGETEHPFTLNGNPLPVAGEGRHDVLYRVIDINPDQLIDPNTNQLYFGDNVIQVLSETDHHGIEIIYPGPALVLQIDSDYMKVF